jgi:hypothetical protein
MAASDTPNWGSDCSELVGQRPEPGSPTGRKSDIRLFGHLQSVVNLYSQVADSAFELGMPQKQLYSPQIFCTPIS